MSRRQRDDSLIIAGAARHPGDDEVALGDGEKLGGGQMDGFHSNSGATPFLGGATPSGGRLWKIHHIGAAVRDLQKAVETYRDLFGYALDSGPFVDEVQGVEVCLLRLGSSPQIMLELVSPIGTPSPIDTILKKRNTAYHVCYEVDDIGSVISEFRRKGCIMVAEPVPAAAFGGRRIAWLYTPTNQLVEILERQNGE